METHQNKIGLGLIRSYFVINTFFKLRRTYSENEAVMWALNKLKELLIERGKSNAYIHELEDKVIKLERELKKCERLPLTPEQRSEYDQYVSMKLETESKSQLKQKIKKLEADNKDLVGRIVRIGL
jgi:hypothetical protein